MMIHFAEPLHAKCAESRLGEVRSEASTRRAAPGGTPARPGGLYRGSRIGPVRSAWSAKRRDTSNCTYRKEAPEREAGRRRASKERATRTDTRREGRDIISPGPSPCPIHPPSESVRSRKPGECLCAGVDSHPPGSPVRFVLSDATRPPTANFEAVLRGRIVMQAIDGSWPDPILRRSYATTAKPRAGGVARAPPPLPAPAKPQAAVASRPPRPPAMVWAILAAFARS